MILTKFRVGSLERCSEGRELGVFLGQFCGEGLLDLLFLLAQGLELGLQGFSCLLEAQAFLIALFRSPNRIIFGQLDLRLILSSRDLQIELILLDQLLNLDLGIFDLPLILPHSFFRPGLLTRHTILQPYNPRSKLLILSLKLSDFSEIIIDLLKIISCFSEGLTFLKAVQLETCSLVDLGELFCGFPKFLFQLLVLQFQVLKVFYYSAQFLQETHFLFVILIDNLKITSKSYFLKCRNPNLKMHLLTLINIFMPFPQIIHLFLEMIYLLTNLLLLGFLELFYFLS